MGLLSNFSSFVSKFTDLTFTPHYFVWTCKVCESFAYKNEVQECISGGRYCSYDPDGNGILEGREVVVEDLRQLCVYNITGKNYQKWFLYVKEFYQSCFKDFSKACIQQSLKTAGVDYEKVQKCMDTSVNGQNLLIDDNYLLKKERETAKTILAPVNPAIFINDQLFRGDIEIGLFIQALCATYNSDKKPEACLGKIIEIKEESHV